MGKSKVQQMKKKILQENLNNLEEKYKQVYQQLNNTLNNGDKDTLKRQIQEIEAEMTDVENQLNSLTPSILIPQTLIQILTSLHETAKSSITKAYQASCPQGFIQQADTLEDILENLQDIPKGNKKFTYIEEFVAYLSIDSQVPQSLSQELQEWGKKYINNFDQLIRDIQSDDNLDNQETKSYLLIQVKPKTDKLDRFYIYAWLIPDIRHYKPEVGDGFKQVSVSKLSQKTFTLQNIPKIVDLLLEDISSEFLGKLTVEFFLPYKLLNHTVDSFIRVEFGTAESIGKKYKVVVRANERLQRNYPYKGIWFNKWQTVKQVYNSQCKQGLVSGNHSQEVIRKKLDTANGIILINIPKSTSIETIFSYILITATPIALWLRKELENQNLTQQSAINSLLDCCIQELPDRVKEQRLDAPESHNDHIGHHISLVWEDPERLTPDAGYFYSTPQSAS
ncbi:MAG: hypothetical protein EA343_14510 [Nodularia sp. (in: Bacteria)]|nr:MAG: hypothetical protein EA343_14510 [Nodularia sp. (in: cyanobacteria)]